MVCSNSARAAAPRRARSLAAVSTLIVVALALACSSHAKSAGDDSTSTAASAGSLADSAAPAPVKGKVHIEVGSGPLAGTYDATMTDGGCSYGLTGPGAWGNQYSVDKKDPKAFTSLQLIVPDTKAAAAGTTVFHLTAGFGPLFGSGATSYDINTTPQGTQGGSGKVTVDDKGTTGKVTFDVKSANGVALKGTIDCNSVMRAS
jgi:hypothetical protein